MLMMSLYLKLGWGGGVGGTGSVNSGAKAGRVEDERWLLRSFDVSGGPDET